MPGLPPKADIARHQSNVRFVSQADKNRRDTSKKIRPVTTKNQGLLQDCGQVDGYGRRTFRASWGPQQMSTLETVIVKLFPLLMFLGLISPLVALLSAVLFYNRHRDRVEPERHVRAIAYVLDAGFSPTLLLLVIRPYTAR